jgi:predicted metal-dependent hydrolase
MTEVQIDSVTWGAVEITYRYHRVRRRTLSISVYPDLSVTVRVPLKTGLETMRRFVLKKAAWISKAWRNFEVYLPKQPPRRYISGETHRYLGRQYRLRVEQGTEDAVKCTRGYLWATTKGEPTPKRAKVLLYAWYRVHARIVFEERLTDCHKKIAKEGIPFPGLSIRQMVSRWGSFSASGRITLNLLLIMVPKECIDYVILHELCHFKVRRHGPRFWKLMERLMPDYEERRRKLNAFAL